VTDVRPDLQRVTLQDVADRAGVSLTTASRVLNDGARRVGKCTSEGNSRVSVGKPLGS